MSRSPLSSKLKRKKKKKKRLMRLKLVRPVKLRVINKREINFQGKSLDWRAIVPIEGIFLLDI